MTITRYKTLEDLNRDLGNIRTMTQFEYFYERLMRDRFERKASYDSCGGTAALIVRYFTDKIGQQLMSNQKLLNKKNNTETLKRILDFKGPWACHMEAPGHVVVVIHTGEHWGFFQSNDGTGRDNFCVLPALNIQRSIWRHYNRPYMNKDDFCGFFRELTNEGNAKTLFWGAKDFVEWEYSVVTFDGLQMK